MDLALFERLRSRLLARVEEMSAILAGAAQSRQALPAISQAALEQSWGAWTLEQRRSFVKLVVSDVVVQPARTGRC